MSKVLRQLSPNILLEITEANPTAQVSFTIVQIDAVNP